MAIGWIVTYVLYQFLCIQTSSGSRCFTQFFLSTSFVPVIKLTAKKGNFTAADDENDPQDDSVGGMLGRVRRV
jgi:hypothetical protein